jgi:outer membrane protein OmpA-like peptidoglycan-associated protein
MAVRRPVLASAVPLTAVLIMTAGCSDSGPAAVRVDPPRAPGGPATASAAGGGMVKEGWFGGADGLHARVEVKGVERQAARSVLRLALTPLASATPSAGASGGAGATMPFAVSLLDPVGRRFYRPLTGGQPAQLTVGAAQELAIEYPPLPQDVQRVTVITPGTAGEFTGVPVTAGTPTGTGTGPGTGTSPGISTSPGTGTVPGGGLGRGFGAVPVGTTTSPPTPSTPTPSTPTPSTTPPGTTSPSGGATDLYSITEGETRDVTSSPSDETLSLRADVLFESGSDKLSARAGQVLDQAAADIRRTISATDRAIAIDGHTDGAGDASRNLDLSRRRAQAVEKELKKRLGDTFTYTATGKGKADPVAKEGGSGDAAARARNRRVEISYKVQQGAATGTPSATATPSATPSASPTSSATPATFRAQDGTTVASRTGRFGQATRRLNVKPFYRDGSYLVAVFEIVNEGPGDTPPDASYAHQDYPGGAFTAFSVSVPGGKDVYRAVRIGAAAPGAYASYVDPGRATFRTGVGQPARGFVYLPAPPGDVKRVTFDAGPFGKIDNVPVN